MTAANGIGVEARNALGLGRGNRRRLAPRVEALEGRALLAAGDLDVTFGQGGVVLTEFGAGITNLASLALQPDGKIVAEGYVSGPGEILSDVAVARYNPDGSLDTTFDGDGIVRLDLNIVSAFGTGVTILPDGRIQVATGMAGPTPFSPTTLSLARLNSDGSADLSFGNGGQTTANLQILSRSILTQGASIFVTGSVPTDSPSVLPPGTFAVQRLNLDGSPDPAYGVGGLAAPNFGNPPQSGGEGRALAALPDGSIVAVGPAGVFGVARFAPDGTPIASVLTNVGGFDQGAFDVAVQADGRIVVSGRSSSTPSVPFSSPIISLVLVRYNSDLSLDPTFGDAGIVRTGTPLGRFSSIVLATQPDGKLVVAGGTDTPDVPVGLVTNRYNSDGSLDLTYGADGTVVTPLTSNAGSLTRATVGDILIQPDGRIVVGSSADFTASSDFALARYLGDSVVPAVPVVEGIFIRAGRDRRFIHPVARFTTSDPAASGDDFRAAISWGDRGRPSFGRVVPSGPGTFLVVGAHRYRRNGLYPTTIQVGDASGNVGLGQGFVSVGRERDHVQHARAIAFGRVPGGPRALIGLRPVLDPAGFQARRRSIR